MTVSAGKKNVASRATLFGLIFAFAGVLAWLALSPAGAPVHASKSGASTVAILNVGILVFREGLECILVLAALTAGMVGARGKQRRPIFIGAAIGFIATLILWRIAVQVIADLSQDVSALEVQAATGLLAVVVLLTVMNWFFHRIYWTGWISLHNKKKRNLLELAVNDGAMSRRLLWGLGLLGFSSMFREGVEVVLFLQSYRLRLGSGPVLDGALIGIGLAGVVAVLTFVAHRRLPYKKMLVLTGVLLGMVLLVMVGEQAQEMQLAGWLSTTTIPWLARVLPAWAGTWFSVFPTVETLVAQLLAALAVLGSYFVARKTVTSREAKTDVAGPHSRVSQSILQS